MTVFAVAVSLASITCIVCSGMRHFRHTHGAGVLPCPAPYAREVGNGKFLILLLHPKHPFPPHKSQKHSTITSVLTLGPTSACSHGWLHRFLSSLAVVPDAQTFTCGASCRQTGGSLSTDSLYPGGCHSILMQNQRYAAPQLFLPILSHLG